MLHSNGLAKLQCRPDVLHLNIGIEDTRHALNAFLPSCLGILQGATYEKAIAGGCQEVHAGIIHHPKALMRDLDLMTASPQCHCLKAYAPSHRASTICNLKWICFGLQGSKSSLPHKAQVWVPLQTKHIGSVQWHGTSCKQGVGMCIYHKGWRQMRWGVWASH